MELPRVASRGIAEIRTDGRNIETFDRLRHWAYASIGEYRCGPGTTWDEVVNARALAIAAEVRATHPAASHPFSDQEAVATAKSVAGWVWSRYDGGSLTRVRADTAARRAADRKRALETRRERGSVAREEYLAAVQRRREEASRLRGLGVAIEEIACRLRAGVRSVHRWLSEIRCVPSPSVLSDFECSREREPRQASLTENDSSDSIVILSSLRCAVGASVVDRCEYAPAARGAEPESKHVQSSSDRSVFDRGGRLAYIQRRIAELVSRARGRA